MIIDRVFEIAQTNDAFRESGQGVTVTRGVQQLPDVEDLLDTIRFFDSFTPDNDPHGEHDFGKVMWYGTAIFWKIDYYNRDLDGGEEALSPDCQRVMTVMLADEY